MRVIWSPLAIERVREIAAWVAADRPAAADDLVDGIVGAVDRLRDVPGSGREVPEFERPDLREVFHGPYRIVYRASSEAVEVLTVRHSLQRMDESALDD